MTTRIGINGFGRIGRTFLRAALKNNADVEVVAVNDLAHSTTLGTLLEWDSLAGHLEGVAIEPDALAVAGHRIAVLGERDPAAIRWGDLGVDVVIESTGFFATREAAAAHLEGGAPRVIVSAPASGADATFVVGVNDDTYDPAKHTVVSNASCTTNCFVPMVKVLDDAFGVEHGLMTTTHAYTGDQSVVDGPHSDPRRARAAAVNIIPTSTGAARATGLVLSAMDGKLDGTSLRVPIPTGSVTDFVAVVGREVTVDEVNAAFEAAATDGRMSKVLDYSTEPLVSSDIVGTAASCTFDSGLTMTQGSLVKVLGWYDNEWGYSNRLVDLAAIVGAAG